MLSISVKASGAPSTEALFLLAYDANGNPTGFTSIRPPNAIQSITFTATPTNNAFTLTFQGQTTIPIPTTTTEPQAYLLWTFQTIVGHIYSIAVTWVNCQYGVAAGDAYLFETIEGANVIDSTTVTGIPAGIFTDIGVTLGDGSLVTWVPVAAGVVATASTIEVRYTATMDYYMRMSGLRVQDVTAGTITYYNVTETANVAIFGTGAWAGVWSYNADTSTYSGYEWANGYGSGLGPTVTITPGGSTAALVLQDALQALSTIGPGNVSVVDNSDGGAGNYAVTLIGLLAGVAQPLITSTATPSGAVVITEVNAGGGVPTLTLPSSSPLGGQPVEPASPIPLDNWLIAKLGTPLPYAYCPFISQSQPEIQTFRANMLPCVGWTTWDGVRPLDLSISGYPIFGWSAGLTLTFTFPELSPGTYTIGLIYPTDTFTLAGHPLIYQPSTATQFLAQDGSGNTLETYSVDQTKPPTGVLGPFTTTVTDNTLVLIMTTVGQSVAASGATVQIVAILDAITFNRISPDTSLMIGDGATIDIPDGWGVTQAGPLPSISGLPVAAPSITAILPPIPQGKKTLLPGYNIEPVSYYHDIVIFSNLAYLMPTMGTVWNANGYPTRFVSSQGGSAYVPIIWPNTATTLADPGQGTYGINAGLFVMTWDGTVNAYLTTAFGGTTIVEQPGSITGQATGNRRVYNIQYDPIQTARPGISFSLDSTTQDLVLDPSGNTYVSDLTNLVITPPNPADPTGMTLWVNPPKFHPWITDSVEGMLAAIKIIRGLDLVNVNSNPASTIAHWKPVTHANRCYPTFAKITVPIVSISQAPDGSYFPPNYFPNLQITTATPHGLYDSCMVAFSGCGSAVFQDGQSFSLDSYPGFLHVVDETTLLCVVDTYTDHETTPMTNILTGGSLVANNVGTIWALQDFVDLFNEAPWLTHLHLPLPIGMDVTPGGDGIDSIATGLLGLPPGTFIMPELANECWNESYPTWFWCALMNSRVTGVYDQSYEIYYANQKNAIDNRFDAIWSAAGRSDHVIHLYGVQGGDTNHTTNILTQAKVNGARVDAVSPAVYTSSWPYAGYSADQLPILNAMIPAQLMDWCQLNTLYGQYPENLVANQVACLAAHGYPDAKVFAYEGSICNLCPPDPPGSPPGVNTPNYAIRQTTMRRDPRIHATKLCEMQGFEDAGLAGMCEFYLAGSANLASYGTYEYSGQLRGTGDPTIDVVNSTNPLMGKNQTVSEVGGAIYAWAMMLDGPVAPQGWVVGTFFTINGRPVVVAVQDSV